MAMPRERVYLALGSNLGDRAGYLAFARTEISRLPGTHIVAVSSVEETAPLGGMDQPGYLNQMILVATDLEPHPLLMACRSIERAAGRDRSARWSSRTLDIDIVRYGNRTLDEADLRIPHPGLANREFWKREIAEVEKLLTEREGQIQV
ncbi:MAG: 2-amino-4-hydroxy-6-hydroxymethyldihydropteridine diphosphokinase [Gemmatimonadota bacterium]